MQQCLSTAAMWVGILMVVNPRGNLLYTIIGDWALKKTFFKYGPLCWFEDENLQLDMCYDLVETDGTIVT